MKKQAEVVGSGHMFLRQSLQGKLEFGFVKTRSSLAWHLRRIKEGAIWIAGGQMDLGTAAVTGMFSDPVSQTKAVCLSTSAIELAF